MLYSTTRVAEADTCSYVADMSPLAGLALAASSSRLQAPIIRDFLQRYISHRVYFGVATVRRHCTVLIV